MVDLNKVYKAKRSMISATPRKLGLVASLVRGLDVSEAVNQLRFCRKFVATDVLKVLQEAVNNAENNFGVDFDMLYVSRVLVGKSVSLKRFRPRAKGRSSRIHKNYSNVCIELKRKVEDK